LHELGPLQTDPRDIEEHFEDIEPGIAEEQPKEESLTESSPQIMVVEDLVKTDPDPPKEPIETSPRSDVDLVNVSQDPPDETLKTRELPELKLQTPRELRLVEKSNPPADMRPFVQSFVANFLEQSLEEYLRSADPPPPTALTNTSSDGATMSQFIPLYIQEMLHSVLQNHLVSALKPSPSELSVLDEETPILPPQDIEPPVVQEEMISVTKAALEYDQKLAEVTASYEERIASYEEKMRELEHNFNKLQKTSHETISSQSRRILTLSELLSEKTAEIASLHSERQIQQQTEKERSQQVDETMGLLNEELSGVREMWKRMERVKEKEKRLLVDRLKEVQDDLTETVEYYQVITSTPLFVSPLTSLSLFL
jgi:hypothetical protein